MKNTAMAAQQGVALAVLRSNVPLSHDNIGYKCAEDQLNAGETMDLEQRAKPDARKHARFAPAVGN